MYKKNPNDPITELATPQGPNKDEKYGFPDAAIVKITSRNKVLLDEIVAFLQIGFECAVTSPKMYSQNNDQFFQYAKVAKKEANP